jgi:hypothetical protein
MFLGAVFGVVGVGGLLAGCGAVGEYQPGTVAEAEVVAVRPWLHYANQMPSRVPAVRLLPSAGSMYTQ